MTDVFVHPRWTPDKLGEFDSVVHALPNSDDELIVPSDVDKTGWWVVGYTEDILTILNLETVSELSVQYEGSLDRQHWLNLPTYDRVTDAFGLSVIIGPGEGSYETLESDRWHYVRLKLNTAATTGVSEVSCIVGIGGATI